LVVGTGSHAACAAAGAAKHAAAASRAAYLNLFGKRGWMTNGIA
jgi:hypothetical protein